MLSSKVLILYFLDGFCMLYLGTNILKCRVEKSRLTYTALLYMLSIYLVRTIYSSFNIPLGSHIILLFVIFCIYCHMICKVSIIYSIVIGYIGYTLMFLGDWIFLAPLTQKLNLVIDAHFFNSWSNILIGLSSYTFSILGSLIFFITKYYRLLNK